MLSFCIFEIAPSYLLQPVVRILPLASSKQVSCLCRVHLAWQIFVQKPAGGWAAAMCVQDTAGVAHILLPL